MKKLLLASVLAIAVTAPAAFADEHMHDKGIKHAKGKMFEQADTNANGSLSMSEFQDFHAKKSAEWFKKLDKNDDGNLTQEEAKEGRKAMKEKMGERRDMRQERRNTAN